MNRRNILGAIFIVLFVIALFTFGLVFMLTPDYIQGVLMVSAATSIVIVMIAMKELKETTK